MPENPNCDHGNRKGPLLVPGYTLGGEIQLAAPGPVLCYWCREPIDEDVYLLCPHVPFGLHPECAVRLVVRSVGHQTGRCPCYGGTYEDPPHMTRREAARAAAQLHEATRDGRN